MLTAWFRRWSWIVAMLVAIVITVGSLVGLESAHRRMAADYETALRAMTAANQLNELVVRNSIMASSQHGYALTRNPAYLDAYRAAAQRIRDLAGKLVPYYAGLHDAAALRAFGDLMRQLSAQIDATDARLRAAEADPARDGVTALQEGLTRLHDAETARADHARERGRADRWLSTLSAAALSLLNVALFVLLFRVLGRQIRQARQGQEHMRAQRAHLDRLVHERTQQLDELATHLQNVSEDEKGKLSRELHDELGAILTACKMDITWVQRQLSAPQPALAEKLSRALRNLDQGIQAKRRIIENLRPTVLANFGLATALRMLAQESAQQNGWRLDLDLPDEDIRLDEGIAIVLFRVAQEALTNAAKYAGASTVRVALGHDARTVRLDIIDNGIGIRPEQVRKPKTHGLAGMRQRVSARGGRIDVRSLPQCPGTEIRVTMPLDTVASGGDAHAAAAARRVSAHADTQTRAR